jgi:hypothetical protein
MRCQDLPGYATDMAHAHLNEEQPFTICGVNVAVLPDDPILERHLGEFFEDSDRGPVAAKAVCPVLYWLTAPIQGTERAAPCEEVRVLPRHRAFARVCAVGYLVRSPDARDEAVPSDLFQHPFLEACFPERGRQFDTGGGSR